MRRSVAITWHASFLVISAALYFFFVLPRWYELTGATSHTLGTVARIVCGLLIAVAALPVLLTLQRTRKPEYGTPQLALSLRTASVALHVLGGVLIIGVAISEIWLSLDRAGQWLFGLYGAAAGIVLLAALAFYLAFVAELPPPPPAPVKIAAIPETAAADESDDSDEAVTETESGDDEQAGSTDEAEDEDDKSDAETTETGAADQDDAEPSAAGKLRNRRSGKGLFGRSSGGA